MLAQRCPSTPFVVAPKQAQPARLTIVKAQAGSAQAVRLPKWDFIWQDLMEKRIPSVSPQKAKEMADSGEWVLLDVRPKEQYQKAHPEGSQNAPLYQAMDMSQMDFAKAMKLAFYKFNGVNPVEANPAFPELVRKAMEGGKGIITMCEAGGTMKASMNFPTGKASRSLQACYRITAEGLAPAVKVAHLDGGVYGWYKAELPFVGEYDDSNVGRTPNAAPDAVFPTNNKK